ncbi:hypothetical protein E5675_15545 [Sphingopyxis sp. PAMC25046]|uniref:hypothetical protein n=1 Tax=Sphingopyxis sp. PAMC25046 TaxID=2565556 RepID=UPI00109DA23F|nr:hypothetical protein [Sphingopyxis sp. PAMC25046]QCB55710.1 hypothetical protein E5675_15545 [Sphingopyxis sp. PAMC25046]
MMDRFLDDTRKQLAFLSDLRADLEDGILSLDGNSAAAATAALDGRIAECRERIERLGCYSSNAVPPPANEVPSR